MRIRITFPSAFSFTIMIPVRISDINYGGHVGNDSILSIVQEARIAFLKQGNMNEMNAGGHGLIMADSAIQYKGEAFHGDIIDASICVGTISSVSFDLYYKLSTNRNEKVIDIAYIKTGMICFDYQERKICTMSELLNQHLNKTL